MTEETPEEVLYCQWHPKVETALRCYQCGAPICSRCARRTPTGYICPACRKGHLRRFESFKNYDYIVVAVTALFLGGLASLIPLIPMSGWFIFIISPLAGTMIAEAVSRLTGRRQSRHLWKIVVAAVVIGSLPLLLFDAFVGIAAFMNGNAWGIWDLFYTLIHLPLVIGAIVLRLRLR